jgi:hypothetical protein
VSSKLSLAALHSLTSSSRLGGSRFIEWSKPEEATRALLTLNGRRIFGVPIRFKRWVSCLYLDLESRPDLLRRRRAPFAGFEKGASRSCSSGDGRCTCSDRTRESMNLLPHKISSERLSPLSLKLARPKKLALWLTKAQRLHLHLVDSFLAFRPCTASFECSSTPRLPPYSFPSPPPARARPSRKLRFALAVRPPPHSLRQAPKLPAPYPLHQNSFIALYTMAPERKNGVQKKKTDKSGLGRAIINRKNKLAKILADPTLVCTD